MTMMPGQRLRAPEQHPRVRELVLAQAAERKTRIVDRLLVARDPHEVGDVPSQVLVGVEDDALAALEGPLVDARRVRRGADDPAVRAGERLQLGVAVHVRDGDRAPCEPALLELQPGVVDEVAVGHVRHRTAGALVGVVDLLVRPREDRGGLHHEADAAKDDELGLLLLAGRAAQLEAVAPEIRQLDDLPALVVVAQDHHSRSELRLDVTDAGDDLGLVHVVRRRRASGLVDQHACRVHEPLHT
jgi:hypothetical protein